jgi:Kdo2-lipid IVA lauroyltransferase/acyltransferase
MNQLAARFGLGLLWLFHWLPLGVQASVGNAVGQLAAVLARPRRKVVERNLTLCFPELNQAQHADLVKRHFKAATRSLLEHGLLFWAPRQRIEKLIRLEGLEHLENLRGKPVILLAPHFVGLDMGGVRLTTVTTAASIYTRQRSKVADHYLRHARSRFSQSVLASRHDGIRPLIKIIRSGLPFYYLPDQDQGRKESIFVPFFGIQTATVSAMSRLAKVTGASVVPLVTRQLPGNQGYEARFYPAWDNYPTNDVAADTARMNRFIEDRVREMPEQYLWLHRRFKTRPEGEPSLYA